MISRFDYVKYDAQAVVAQDNFKSKVVDLEKMIDSFVLAPRAKSFALRSLEECYMWIGKAIRDEQLQRNGCYELQEERKSG